MMVFPTMVLLQVALPMVDLLPMMELLLMARPIQVQSLMVMEEMVPWVTSMMRLLMPQDTLPTLEATSDQAGRKGQRRGGVGVHPGHALVLVNYSSGDGQELLALAAEIVDSVQRRFGVRLVMEPRVYGLASE